MLLLFLTFLFLGFPLIFPGAPFLPSFRRKNKEKIESVIDYVLQIAPGKKMLDVGSGDGRVVIEFAKKGFDSTGIEFNPFLFFWSKMAIKKESAKNKNLKANVIKHNFWNVDFSEYDVIFVFQLSSVNLLLVNKFRKELKPGSIIISAGFKMFNLELIKQDGIFEIYRI